MIVLLRADASPLQGTGHVMRCLTVGEELTRRGHEVVLMTNDSGVAWLERVITDSQLHIYRTATNSLDARKIRDLAPDWVVVDSYEIGAQDISALRSWCHVLAIVDGDDRGIDADLYLDHNLGSEDGPWGQSTRERLLAGSEFALIRHAVLREKRQQPWIPRGLTPHIVAFMGGSDPTGAIVPVAGAFAMMEGDLTASVIADPRWRADVEEKLRGIPGIELLEPTAELPRLLRRADIAVSAAGTSAWELCSLGIPSLLISVVENQRESLTRLETRGLVLGLDLSQGGRESAEARIVERVTRLLSSESEREKLSLDCTGTYDGRGKERVVSAMELLGASSN